MPARQRVRLLLNAFHTVGLDDLYRMRVAVSVCRNRCGVHRIDKRILSVLTGIDSLSPTTRTPKAGIWLAVVLVVAVAAVFIVPKVRRPRQISLRGAVIRQDTDPSKQIPLAGVEITAATEGFTEKAQSDQAGLFSFTFPYVLGSRQSVVFRFEHSGYQPLQLNDIVDEKLYIARMIPAAAQSTTPAPGGPPQVISNVRVRYIFRSSSVADVGSAVKTFEVANTANVPCEQHSLCSPDKKWKAASATVVLDAGEGNEFRNVRASCIAGPCPFTRIERQTLSDEGRHLSVSAEAWSDTATFLVEAEVVRRAENDIVRESYPAIFGPSLSFTLPNSAEGPSFEADLNGQPIVFPMGPNLSLSWAQCTQARINDQATAYRCELRPGYRFQ